MEISLKTADGKPIEAMTKILQARSKELGETTKQACIAMATNILRSLRVQTKVANENKMDLEITLADDKFYPSFARQKGSKGKNISTRVLRHGQNGPVVQPEKVVWKIGKYVKGQIAHSYEVKDKISEDKTIQYIIVAESAEQAKNYAKETHKNRVMRYKSLARFAIGLAMKSIYDKGGGIDNTTQYARRVAQNNVETTVSESGFNSGSANVHIHDKLNYAALALKNGEGSVNIAIQNALKKMIGYIKHKTQNKSLTESLKTSLDELVS